MTDDTGDPIATFSRADLERMRDNAFREATRAWMEYRAADAKREDSADARWLAQSLHDAAWSAENFWRKLYDATKERAS